MIPYRVHLHNEEGEVEEEGIWYKIAENVMIRLDDPVEYRNLVDNMTNHEVSIIEDWNSYDYSEEE